MTQAKAMKANNPPKRWNWQKNKKEKFPKTSELYWENSELFKDHLALGKRGKTGATSGQAVESINFVVALRDLKRNEI